MKKLVLSLAVIIAFSVSFTSCNEESRPPMNGTWRCVEIRAGGGGVVSLPTPINPELLRFFSVNYIGIGNTGAFARVGADAGDLTGLLAGATGATEQDQAIWRNFLTAGQFTFTGNSTNGTIIHTAGGVSTTYRYFMPDRDTLILREYIATVGGPAVGGVLDMINLIFGTQVNNAAYIEYVYVRDNAILGLFPSRD